VRTWRHLSFRESWAIASRTLRVHRQQVSEFMLPHGRPDLSAQNLLGALVKIFISSRRLAPEHKRRARIRTLSLLGSEASPHRRPADRCAAPKFARSASWFVCSLEEAITDSSASFMAAWNTPRRKALSTDTTKL